MRHVKRRTTNESNIISLKPKTTTIGNLEKYLGNCQNKTDRHEFATSQEAYDYGKKLREIAMKEEGVASQDMMKKFDVEIMYQSVKIRLLNDSEEEIKEIE